MLLKHFNRKRDIGNIFFVALIIPYLLLCLTMGGFHEGISGANHCSHDLQSGSYGNHDDAGCRLVEKRDTIAQHDSETCQICHWLKTPSASESFLTVDAQFGFVCIRSPGNFKLLLPSLSIQKFTIRPPPAGSCFSA